MKKFLLCFVFAVLGVLIAIGSAFNEGWTVSGAWTGTIYACVVGALIALAEDQIWKKSLDTICAHGGCIVGGAIIGALCFTIF